MMILRSASSPGPVLIQSSRGLRCGAAGVLALALAQPAVAAEATGGWAAVGGSLGGLLLGVIQLIVGLSLAAFSITKGLQLLSRLLGGIDIWRRFAPATSRSPCSPPGWSFPTPGSSRAALMR